MQENTLFTPVLFTKESHRPGVVNFTTNATVSNQYIFDKEHVVDLHDIKVFYIREFFAQCQNSLSFLMT